MTRALAALAVLAALLLPPPPPLPAEEPPPAPPAEAPHRVNRVFRHRGAPREAVFKETGSAAFGKETEAAVEAALDWLVRHQSPSGAWDVDGFTAACGADPCEGKGSAFYDPGVTGLSLLALLGAGVRPGAADARSRAADLGLRWLAGLQDEQGCFGSRAMTHFIYNHAIASLAMAEAWALTGDPLWRSPAQRGLDFVLECRNPGRAWRYGVRPGDNDTSVTGWMCMALQTGAWGGLRVPVTPFREAISWLDEVTDPGTGRTGYTARGNGPARPQELMDRYPSEKSESLTAISVAVRWLCGRGAADPLTGKGMALLRATPPVWDHPAGSIDFYYWHYGTQAALQSGGEDWRKWQAALVKAALAGQVRDEKSHARGSWPARDPWAGEGGRIYGTALLALCLEAPYRLARVGDGAPERTSLSLATEPPGAAVRIGGEYLGTTPLQGVLVPPGRAELEIRHPATRDLAIPVSPEPLQSLDLGKVVLEAGARVDLSALPPGVKAWHEGRKVSGVAPVRPGRVRLLLTQPRALSRVLLLEVPDGATAVPELPALPAARDWSGASTREIPGPPAGAEGPREIPAGVRLVEGRWWLEKDGSELVRIPARTAEEEGRTVVRAPALFAGRCEVTVEQFEKYAAETHRPVPKQPSGSSREHPVVGVSCLEAEAYAAWAGGRLPTPEEWLQAASVGISPGADGGGPSWPWGAFDGEEARLLRGPGEPAKRPAKVGSFPGGMGATGILDVVGNAAEWCMESVTTGEGPQRWTRVHRRLMGGSWLEASLSREGGVGKAEADAGFRFVVPAR